MSERYRIIRSPYVAVKNGTIGTLLLRERIDGPEKELLAIRCTGREIWHFYPREVVKYES